MVLVCEVGVTEDSMDGYLLVAWLHKHNPDVNWETGQLKCRSRYCIENCLLKQVNASLVNEAHLVKEVQDSTDACIATIEWSTEDGLEVFKVLPIGYHK